MPNENVQDDLLDCSCIPPLQSGQAINLRAMPCGGNSQTNRRAAAEAKNRRSAARLPHLFWCISFRVQRQIIIVGGNHEDAQTAEFRTGSFAAGIRRKCFWVDGG